MSKHTAENDRTHWWITTDFLDKGGRKVMGPFGSRGLAIEVRSLRETVEGHAAYFVDSERVTPPGETRP